MSSWEKPSSAHFWFSQWLRAVFCSLLAAYLLAGPAAAQDEKNGEDGENPQSTNEQAQEALAQLQKVRADIKREENRLKALRQRQKEIEADVKKAESDYSTAVMEKEQVLEQITQLDADMAALTQAMEQRRAESASVKESLTKRIVALYKTRRRTAGLDYLIRSTSATDFLKRAYYLALVSKSDREQIETLARELDRLSEDERRMQRMKEEKQGKAVQAVELEKKLQTKKVEKAALLREETEKQKLSEKTLAKLEKSADSLEEMISGMTGSEEKPPEPPPKGQKPAAVAVVSAVSRSAKALITVPPFEGRGLAKLKGQLEFPVDGRIVQHYGRQQHEEFADILFIKGLEVRGTSGGKVRAIAGGKVMFSSVLPGYGNVVIIDHGSRYYTLYGRLSRALCRVGDTVQPGDSIAELGKPDHKGRNFYFELRVQGKATDPSKYFRKLPPEDRS